MALLSTDCNNVRCNPLTFNHGAQPRNVQNKAPADLARGCGSSGETQRGPSRFAGAGRRVRCQPRTGLCQRRGPAGHGEPLFLHCFNVGATSAQRGREFFDGQQTMFEPNHRSSALPSACFCASASASSTARISSQRSCRRGRAGVPSSFTMTANRGCRGM
jgi:hypothetical protein